MSGGKVEVFGQGLSGAKSYYVHLETRIGIHGKPERCVNADKDGCGGIGSCVHCDICKNMVRGFLMQKLNYCFRVATCVTLSKSIKKMHPQNAVFKDWPKENMTICH